MLYHQEERETPEQGTNQEVFIEKNVVFSNNFLSN